MPQAEPVFVFGLRDECGRIMASYTYDVPSLDCYIPSGRFYIDAVDLGARCILDDDTMRNMTLAELADSSASYGAMLL